VSKKVKSKVKGTSVVKEENTDIELVTFSMKGTNYKEERR
jgi:hypothetical protein